MTSEQMADHVLNTAKLAMTGSRKMILTFKPEAAKHIGYVWSEVLGKRISLDRTAAMSVMSVMSSNSWGEEHNRTLLISLLDGFNTWAFAQSFHQILDEIWVVG
jgi:hypothetical protein